MSAETTLISHPNQLAIASRYAVLLSLSGSDFVKELVDIHRIFYLIIFIY